MPSPVLPTYETLFAEAIECVNQQLASYLTESADPLFAGKPEGPAHLWEAMRYSTLNGGKRIRSVFAIETCLACGGRMENILPTACAIELVHAQSLIHDDLPCMDNDDLRRGKPTLHRAFDESTAVLTGDALLAMAFGLITKHTPCSDQVTPQTILEVISDFSDVASVQGLVNGQYVDIRYEGQPFTAEILEYIHSYKTGALFSFSVRAGAKLSGTSVEVVEPLTLYGKKLGLAFQIVDDLLDIQSTSETLGKTAGKDQIQEKATFPALYGVTASRVQAEQLITEARLLIEAIPGLQAERLNTLADFIRIRV